jgi:DnaK suppressor protein
LLSRKIVNHRSLAVGIAKQGEGEMKKKTERANVGFNLLKARLESVKKRLAGELEQLKSSVRPADERREGSPFGKREEEATESFELERRLTLEKRLREQLAEVEHALKKFKDGTYGLCDNCGKSISPERLEALPQASLCLECKARLAKEAKGK